MSVQCRPSYKLRCSITFNIPIVLKKNCINLSYIYKCLTLYPRVFDVANNEFGFINVSSDFPNFKGRDHRIGIRVCGRERAGRSM